MAKFRKKPVVIEAIQFVTRSDEADSMAARARVTEWLAGMAAPSDGWIFTLNWIDIPTLEGVMRASHGDWIIRGVKDEFYPVKPDIFSATYEPA
jgi:hypothetical protein